MLVGAHAHAALLEDAYITLAPHSYQSDIIKQHICDLGNKNTNIYMKKRDFTLSTRPPEVCRTLLRIHLLVVCRFRHINNNKRQYK